MAWVSAKGYIRLHAVFQLVLAVYLTNSREVISDSELVHKVNDGLRIDNIKTFTFPRSPFAYCGILLLTFALFDLTLAIKLPTLNHILTIARFIRQQQTQQDQAQAQHQALSQTYQPGPRSRRTLRSQTNTNSTTRPTSNSNTHANTNANTNANADPSATAGLNDAAVKITAEFSNLYRQLCILLISLRSWIFFVIALRIYLSPVDEWSAAAASAVTSGFGAGAAPGAGVGYRSREGDTSIYSPSVRWGQGGVVWFDGFEAFGGTAIAAGNAMDIGASVDDLKKKVVLGYGLVEVMFSCWILLALRDEKKKTENQLRSVGIRFIPGAV